MTFSIISGPPLGGRFRVTSRRLQSVCPCLAVYWMCRHTTVPIQFNWRQAGAAAAARSNTLAALACVRC